MSRPKNPARSVVVALQGWLLRSLSKGSAKIGWRLSPKGQTMKNRAAVRRNIIWSWSAAPLLVALAVATVAVAQHASQAPSIKRPATADEVARIPLDEFERNAADLIVLDVRTTEQYRAGHIPGAQSAPLAQLTSRIPDLKRAGKPIVTYCA
jgi:hypothetical protein